MLACPSNGGTPGMGNSRSVIRTQRRKKLRAIEYLGGKCSLCGYHKCQAALGFHHVDPTQKEHSVTYIVMRWRWEKVKPELDKCILVCNNCHAEVHFGMHSPDRCKRILLRAVKKVCPICGDEFQSKTAGQRYCSRACGYLGQRKVLRPLPSQLRKDMKELTWSALAKKYEVSIPAVKKWCRRYGLIE
jgi:hypothetical protein